MMQTRLRSCTIIIYCISRQRLKSMKGFSLFLFYPLFSRFSGVFDVFFNSSIACPTRDFANVQCSMLNAQRTKKGSHRHFRAGSCNKLSIKNLVLSNVISRELYSSSMVSSQRPPPKPLERTSDFSDTSTVLLTSNDELDNN